MNKFRFIIAITLVAVLACIGAAPLVLRGTALPQSEIKNVKRTLNGVMSWLE